MKEEEPKKDEEASSRASSLSSSSSFASLLFCFDFAVTTIHHVLLCQENDAYLGIFA